MKIGVIVPQGWTQEYSGWQSIDAWARTRDLASQVEALGFESVWVFDHFHTVPRPTEEITFESFSTLAALASETRRVRLGHVVLCAAYRNPALTAKMISTLDVITNGRMEIGIGAGWKRDEWRAYGYGFPNAPVRLAILKDQLEVITAMMGDGRATYIGEHHSVENAINRPLPIQKPRVPIMVGGNGRNVTWRLAARYADELNLDGLTPAEIAEELPTIAARCEEIGRDPSTLSVSVHVWWATLSESGQGRIDMLGEYGRLGLSRVIGMIRESVDSDDALAHFADDARAAGAELEAEHRPGIVNTLPRVVTRVTTGVTALVALVLALPASALAHTISDRYQAPLPLIVYVAGAGLAVAMSFAFVMYRNAPHPTDDAVGPERKVWRWLRVLLGALGLIGWLWIVAQTLYGGSGAGDVASLFLWVYGWVGVALISALVGPAWAWIDPFTTIHRLLSWLAGRFGMTGGETSEFPHRLATWPAVVGFAIVIWLELVARVDGGRPLGLLLVAYTLVTLAGMSYFGRENWRANAEIFSVWFRLLGRLAPFALVGQPEDGTVRRRPFGAGLLAGGWSVDQLVMIALGTGAIIFDGLSQTQIYFDLFGNVDLLGLPVVRDTLIAAAFLGGLVAIVLAIARRLNVAALCAGLLPVAVGYLVAHYLTYLLVDGQRIVAAINDPLLRGDNLLPLDLAFYEPVAFMPPAVIWSIQLAAVVGGHIVGAWAGHAALAEDGKSVQIARQLPLAALMVALTSLTLWSLGQAVLSPTQPVPQPAASTVWAGTVSADTVSLQGDDSPGT